MKIKYSLLKIFPLQRTVRGLSACADQSEAVYSAASEGILFLSNIKPKTS